MNVYYPAFDLHQNSNLFSIMLSSVIPRKDTKKTKPKINTGVVTAYLNL